MFPVFEVAEVTLSKLFHICPKSYACKYRDRYGKLKRMKLVATNKYNMHLILLIGILYYLLCVHHL